MNVWTTLKLEVRGNHIKAYVNDEIFFNLCDNTHTSGSAGLANAGAITRFDDVGIFEHELAVLSPNGGENIVAGNKDAENKYKITWVRNTKIQNVSIEYSVNGGHSWQEIVANTDNDGEYVWIVPDVRSNQCLIRIHDSANMDIFDISNDVFTIFNCIPQSPADFNKDCYVNLIDFADFAEQWLNSVNPLDNNYGTVRLDYGLISYYKFDDTTGEVKDETGNHPGINYGATPGVEGINGTAYEFDGVNDLISVENKYPTDHDLTISLWIYFNTIEEGHTFIKERGPTDYVAQNWIDVSMTNGTIGGYIHNGIDSISCQSGADYFNNIQIATGKWIHYVWSLDYQARTLRTWINGYLHSEDTTPSFVGFPASAIYGNMTFMGHSIDWQGDPATYVNGKLDELRIYNRTLNAAEIHELYQNP